MPSSCVIDSIVNVPNEEEARHQIDRAMKWFEDHDATRAVQKLHEEKDDLLANVRFPKAYWKRLRTINSVERLNQEVKRRFDVVGVFPERESIVRLGGSYLRHQHDSWISGKRYFNKEFIQQLMENYEGTKSNVVKLSSA